MMRTLHSSRFSAAPEASDNKPEPDFREPSLLRKARVVLAKLSLQDAEWRSKVTEGAAGVPKLEQYEGLGGSGPAAAALKALERVIEAETARAKRIVETDGDISGLRPKDSPIPGPLGEAERRAILALEELAAAEYERARVGADTGLTVRPRDAAHPEMVGPLGELERKTTRTLAAIARSERDRVAKGLLRPADLPDGERSVLGDWEQTASDLVRAEAARLEVILQSGDWGVRPMDTPGFENSAMATTERSLLATAEAVRAYELARLEQLRSRGLLPQRPMEAEPESAAGIAERLGVGVLRAPVMLALTAARTLELLLAAATERADLEHAEREALEQGGVQVGKLGETVSGGAVEAVKRAPLLTVEVGRRTKELLDVTDGATEKKGGL